MIVKWDLKKLDEIKIKLNIKKYMNIPESIRNEIINIDKAIYLADLFLKKEILSQINEENLAHLRERIPCYFTFNDLENCPTYDYGTKPLQLLESMKNFDLDLLLSISSDLMEIIHTNINNLKDKINKLDNNEPILIDGLSGIIMIGSIKDDHIKTENNIIPSIIIEPAGNDYYTGKIAAAGNLENENLPNVALVIDFAGNDTYQSNGKRSCGSAILGIAALIDMNGNDTYRSGNFSQGTGLFGVGILEDRNGMDVYEADLTVQGAGAVGAGILLDIHGTDNYKAGMYAQGIGLPRGFGLLHDRWGYDVYYAGGRHDAYPIWGQWLLSCAQGYAFGMRDYASGGIGMLHDRWGNDFYNAEVFSQGGSYWYGIGSLIDDQGKDQYSSHVYSQAAGVHLSCGIILDRGGDDMYNSAHQAQGFAHDLSVGILIDEGGNDNYSSNTNGQGFAVTNSVAMLIDRDGNDGYVCTISRKESGYGELKRGFGDIGIQIDMFGNDSYSYEFAGNGKWWNIRKWFVGVDVPDKWWNIEKDKDGKILKRTLNIP